MAEAPKFLGIITAFLVSSGLAGCTLADTAPPLPSPGNSISGKAMGGQQPVTGAKIYLLAVNPAGYGSGSLSLLTSASTGNAVDSIGAYSTTAPGTGIFNLAGDYTCTQGYALGASTPSGATSLSGDEQIYIYALGGNSGSGNNGAVGLIAALGPCNAQYSSGFLIINELTTVAAAYAFSGFASDATHMASSGSALARTGLINAGLNSSNLVNLNSGLPVDTTAQITRPASLLVTLGNILAACVNGTSGNSNCSTLFAYAKSSGATGTAPTDTASASIDLAHNPWPTAAGMTALYGLVLGTGAAFGGGLTSQPNDFTVGIVYSGGGLYGPQSIAIDASGNAWVGNRIGNSVSKFSTTGTPISPANTGYTGGGVSGPQSIAIDASGNVWLANNASNVEAYTNSDGNSISEFSSTGFPLSPATTGYTGGGLNSPYSIAIDASGSAWIANNGNSSVSKFSNTGAPISSSNGYTGGTLSGPLAIAIDGSGNAWVGNYSGGAITKLSNAGVVLSGSGYSGGGLNNSFGIAIDSSANVWAANQGNNSVSTFSSAGNATSPASGYTGGGVSAPNSIAIDGSGNAWIPNYGGSSVSMFSATGVAVSPSTGYTGGHPANAAAVAIDGSGDVWIGNNGNQTVTELIGAATPVLTPLCASIIIPYTTPASRP